MKFAKELDSLDVNIPYLEEDSPEARVIAEARRQVDELATWLSLAREELLKLTPQLEASATEVWAMSMIGNYMRVSPAHLAELRANPESVVEFLQSEDAEQNGRHLDIDKTWHAIHFLLNGDAWEGEPPLVNAVLGGEPLGDVDVGYGPARFLLPREVQLLADAVPEISAPRR